MTALAACVDVMERMGPPAIARGGHCEEQDWNQTLRLASAVLAAR